MRRGTLCWINMEPAHPPEFGKIWPGLVISNTEQNTRLPTVVVLPLSTRPPEIWPLRLRLKIPGQARDSFVILPGIRQVNKTRLQETMGLAPAGFLEKVEKALEVYLRD